MSVNQELVVRALGGGHAGESQPFSDLKIKGVVLNIILWRRSQQDYVKRWPNPLGGSVDNQLVNLRCRVFLCLAKVNIYGWGAPEFGLSMFEDCDAFRRIFRFQGIFLDVSLCAPEFPRIT